MRNAHLKIRDGRLVRLLVSLWGDRKGVTAIITALGSTALMGFAGLAIDAAVWQVNQRKDQGAADQAAVAAGLAANLGNDMTTEAKAVAASFGLVDGSGGVIVTVNNPPSQGTYKTDNSALEVVISQPQPQYLSRFFLSTAPTVTVRAVALFGNKGGTGSNAGGPAGQMCVMSLDQTGKLAIGALDLTGTPTISTPTCDVYNDSLSVDGTEVSGSATLSARNIFLSGYYETSGGGTMSASGVIRTYVNPMPDPYRYEVIPSYSGCTKTGYSLSPSNSDTLSPGVYCNGMDIKGNLTLNPGTYIVNGGDFKAAAGATITGTGVTIIMTSSTGSNYGTVTINGGATLNISAPTAEASLGIPGIAFWIDKNAPTGTAKFTGGSTQIINGAIYLPSQQAQYSGGASAGTSCSQLVALTITFTGNAYFKHDCADSGVIDPPATPIVVQ